MSPQVLNWTLGIDTAIEDPDEVVGGRENAVRDEDLWCGMNNGGQSLMDKLISI